MLTIPTVCIFPIGVRIFEWLAFGRFLQMTTGCRKISLVTVEVFYPVADATNIFVGTESGWKGMQQTEDQWVSRNTPHLRDPALWTVKPRGSWYLQCTIAIARLLQLLRHSVSRMKWPLKGSQPIRSPRVWKCRWHQRQIFSFGTKEMHGSSPNLWRLQEFLSMEHIPSAFPFTETPFHFLPYLTWSASEKSDD